MCGITGFFSPGHFFSEPELRKMTNALAHRGPDADGIYLADSVGLGHRRLSIIDVSEKANQPMRSACGRYVMVFNGEIYNYKEIAKKLPAGTRLKTHSDTEVILEAFAKWGIESIKELNGMFAIAIYDEEKKELYIFRDRSGIKPLYYYYANNNLAFASELKALKGLNIPYFLNKVAIYNFLHLGYIPAPHSIYTGICKLEKGHYLLVKDKELTEGSYIKTEEIIEGELIENESTALKTLDKLVNKAVQSQLVSDVPLGTFLSGGIDSSLVTAVASKDIDKLNTFSIGFSEAKYNESKHAAKIASYLNTRHHEFMVSYKDAIGLVESLTYVYDEPYADSSAIPTMLVSKLAKEHVTVALSGDGADELFMGYGAYIWAERLDNGILDLGHSSASLFLSMLPGKYQKISKLLDYDDDTDIKSHIFSQEQNSFSQPELQKLLYNNTVQFKSPEYDTFKRKLTTIEKQALFDIDYYLPDDLLVKVDRASMHYGLEVRVPFLDNEILHFALNLSPELKYNNATTKYLLKEVLYKYIPASYFNRPKQGFSIPLETWLGTELKYLVDRYLSDEIIEQFGIVKVMEVRKLKKAFLNGKTGLYNRVWLLIVLHKWLKENE